MVDMPLNKGTKTHRTYLAIRLVFNEADIAVYLPSTDRKTKDRQSQIWQMQNTKHLSKAGEYSDRNIFLKIINQYALITKSRSKNIQAKIVWPLMDPFFFFFTFLSLIKDFFYQIQCIDHSLLFSFFLSSKSMPLCGRIVSIDFLC